MPGQTFEYNRWMDDNHPGMVALSGGTEAKAVEESPAKVSAPAFRQADF